MRRFTLVLLLVVALLNVTPSAWWAVLRTELMEGTGTPSGWTNCAGSCSGTVDWDEATVVGEGAQSLEITSAGTNDSTSANLGGSTYVTAYAFFKWRWASLAGTTDIFHLQSSGSNRLFIRTNGTGQITAAHGTGTATITDSVPVDTWVYIWARYTQGTGADGSYEAGWSTDCTRPTAGSPKYTSDVDGTATSTVNGVHLGQIASETHTMYFDQVIVDDAAFPDVCAGTLPKMLLLGVGEPLW